ncbi:MAG: hypothetical protein IJ345_01770 [Clostridia bacterium]|nr:hypothetical protein [Clostridia bacterium]
MKESKILLFNNNPNAYVAGSDCERVIKKYAVAPNGVVFSHVSDFPKWEETLNSYLREGWTVSGITGETNNITVLLVR